MIGVTYWTRVTMPVGRTYHVCDDDVWTTLSRPRRAASKSALPGIALVTFRGGRRGLDHVIAVHGIGIDIDGGASLSEVLDAWRGAYGYVHSTPSSTAADPRWRIVLVLAAPMTNGENARHVIRWAQRRTPGKVDMGTCDPSRLWFLPWTGAAHWQHAGLVGRPIDGVAVAVEERAREERERAERQSRRFAPLPVTDGTYSERALSKACGAVASATEGERHDLLTREAWNVGQLVGAGLLARSTAIDSLRRAALRVFPENRHREVARTIEGQIDLGAQTPRQIRRSPWG